MMVLDSGLLFWATLYTSNKQSEYFASKVVWHTFFFQSLELEEISSDKSLKNVSLRRTWHLDLHFSTNFLTPSLHQQQSDQHRSC